MATLAQIRAAREAKRQPKKKYNPVCVHPLCTDLKHRSEFCIRHADPIKTSCKIKTKIIETVEIPKTFKKKKIVLNRQKHPVRFTAPKRQGVSKETTAVAVEDLRRVVKEPEAVEQALYKVASKSEAKYMRKLAIIMCLAPRLEEMTPKEYVSIRLGKVVVDGLTGLQLQAAIRQDTMRLRQRYDMIADPSKHRPQRPTCKAPEPPSSVPFYKVWHNPYLRQIIYTHARGRDAAKAAMTGNLEAFKYSVLENYSSQVMDWAAGNGHLEVVKWLHENRSEGCTTWAMDWAAERGHLEVVHWLHENRNEGCTEIAMNLAAEGGHLEVVKFLHETGRAKCTVIAMDLAASGGHLEVVRWLHENRDEGCSINAMNWAAQNGHLKVVKWLHKNRSEGCTTYAMDLAARKGHLKVIKWLHKNRNEGCTIFAIDWATEEGHTDVVNFLSKKYKSSQKQ